MSIVYDGAAKTFKLDTPSTSYIMRIGEGGYLLHVYYGARVLETDLSYLNITSGIGASFSADSVSGHISCDIAPMEYSCANSGDMRVTSLLIRGEGGSSATDIRYVSHKIYSGKPKLAGLPATYANSDSDCDTLELETLDSLTGARVTLIYTAFNIADAIARSVRVENTSDKPFDIERVYSMNLDIERADFDVIGLWGTWARERNVDRSPIMHGVQTIESRRGSSSHHHNPFMALCEHSAGEENGDVYGISLIYSGNFAIDCEVDAFDRTRIIAGINPYDFGWHLEPGEAFTSPEAVMVFSDSGLGKMSRTFHKLYRYNLCRGEWKCKERPILVNNWEATYFNFDDEKLVSIARDAKELGIEMLVMDDGWFGERSSDNCSLGDWTVNENKLKGGLRPLVERVNALGLKFGIWFEPEMISPVSELYKAHPDWTLCTEGRDKSVGRSQYVLDMSRADVRDYLFDSISAILDSANIEYVKWDFNRNITEAAGALLPPARRKEIFHRYVLGLYELLERLVSAYPKLLLEGCSGGGGRFDAGMLYYSPQIWTSDDTDAIERLDIQWGTLTVYPSSSMSAHVSASPNHQTGRVTTFKTRGDVAMAGAFGYELDLNAVSPEDKEIIRSQVADFHKFYNVVQNGDYYRLVSPFENRYMCAWEYVSTDKNECLATLAVMRARVHNPLRLRLRGLDPDKRYRDSDTGEIHYGSTLMNAGLYFSHGQHDYQTIRKYFTAV